MPNGSLGRFIDPYRRPPFYIIVLGLKERLLLRKCHLYTDYTDYTDCTDFNRNFEGIAAIQIAAI
jgi:hypothetical protein